MIFWRTFLDSLKIPQKNSVFKLNRIGMDIAVIYMFILLAIVSIPSLIEQIKINSTSTIHIHTFFLLIFFFIFYYLVLVICIFILISIYAYLGTKLAMVTHRRLHFSILWKMVAFSTTLPFIIYTIIALFYPISNILIWIFLVYTTLILIKIIMIYPRVKPKT